VKDYRAEKIVTRVVRLSDPPVSSASRIEATLRGAHELTEYFTTSPVGQTVRQLPFLVGMSKPILDILTQIAAMARAEAHVCVYGESGTGKGLVARAIHYSSRRANWPLIVFDCAAIPEGLMESEWFGHLAGSFASAVTDRDGMFHLAKGGSLVVDKIEELSLASQTKLLRVLQSGGFRKVGGNNLIKADVRIIAVSIKNLSELVDLGRFRRDLFSRLSTMSVTLPPLRERAQDIPILADHFIQRFNRHNERQIKGVSLKTMGALLRYDWPGNLRELESCIERAAVMCDGDTLELEELSQFLRPERRRSHPISPGDSSWPRSLKDAEQDFILKTLRRLDGNRAQTAKLLGISLRGLYYKLKGIERDRIPTCNRRVPRPSQPLRSSVSGIRSV
jgi:two-component system response regulator AtoC